MKGGMSLDISEKFETFSELPLDLPFDVDSIVDDSVLSIEHAQIFVGG